MSKHIKLTVFIFSIIFSIQLSFEPAFAQSSSKKISTKGITLSGANAYIEQTGSDTVRIKDGLKVDNNFSLNGDIALQDGKTVDGVDISALSATVTELQSDVGGTTLPTDCSNGQIIVYESSSGHWICGTDADTDTNTTYSAGTGLTLSGTTFSLADSAVSTSKLVDSSVTTAKVADSAVTTAKIADGTITNTDISSSAAIPFSKLNIAKSDIEGLGIPGSDTDTTYTAGTGLSLSGTTFSLANDSVTSAKIVNGAIANVDISDTAAIAYSKLNLSDSIFNTDIASSAGIAFSKLNIVKADIVGLGIPGDDTDTTYTAGTGLSLSGTTFSIQTNVATASAWTNWTPTLQNAIDNTITTSKYKLIHGDTVAFELNAVVVSNGTPVTFTLPQTPASKVAFGCVLIEESTIYHPCAAFINGSNKLTVGAISSGNLTMTNTTTYDLMISGTYQY